MVANDILFSICVVTFNSESTIIETLESIKQIKYPNIELIISDDCSNDGTINKCTLWLEPNKARFARTSILQVEHNTFTSANCNRALRECTGQWVCLLAGDDILYPDSISKVVNFINNNPESKWIVGKYNMFHGSCVPENFIDEGNLFSDDWKNLFLLSCKEQYKLILSKNFIFLPTAFCQKQVLLNVGGYDEKYGVLEDFPMNIKLLKNNYKCYFLDEYIMGYRSGASNVCNNTATLFNINHMRLRYQVIQDYCFNYYNLPKKCNAKINMIIYNIFYRLGLDKNNTVNRLLLHSILKLNNMLFKGNIINI